MLESTQQPSATCLESAAPIDAPHVGETAARRVRRARAVLVRRSTEEAERRIAALVERMRQQGASGVLSGEIASLSVAMLAEMWHAGRRMRPSEDLTFVILGAIAGRAGMGERRARLAMDAGVLCLTDALRSEADRSVSQWPGSVRGEVLDQLLGEAQAFGETAGWALHHGAETSADGAAHPGDVPQRVVDDADVAVTVASAEAAVESVRFGVAILVHPEDDTEALDAAVQEIRDEIPQARVAEVAPPDAHAVVVTVTLDPEAWTAARDRIGWIAGKAGALAISPTSTAHPEALGDLYRDTRDSVGTVLQRFGSTTGLIDPVSLHDPDRGSTVVPLPSRLGTIGHDPDPA